MPRTEKNQSVTGTSSPNSCGRNRGQTFSEMQMTDAAADLAGLGQRLAVGQADDRPGEESIPRAGGVDDIDLLGGHHAALAVGAGVDGALLAHRHDHAGNVGAAHVGGQRG